MGRLKKISLAMLLMLSVVILSSCGNQQKADFSRFSKIAELSTYDSYYHNVASFEDPGTQIFIRFGNKKVWIEYTGVVSIGIDVSKVKILEKDNSIVEISIPPVKVLGSKIEKDGIERILPENSLLAVITAEDKVAAIADAQKNMEEAASKDEALLAQGKERVKFLLENFVKTVGKQIGKSYSIEWYDIE